MEILEKERAVLAYSLTLVRVRDWCTIASSIDGVFASGLSVLLVGGELVLNVGSEGGVL